MLASGEGSIYGHCDLITDLGPSRLLRVHPRSNCSSLCSGTLYNPKRFLHLRLLNYCDMEKAGTAKHWFLLRSESS